MKKGIAGREDYFNRIAAIVGGEKGTLSESSVRWRWAEKKKIGEKKDIVKMAESRAGMD